MNFMPDGKSVKKKEDLWSGQFAYRNTEGKDASQGAQVVLGRSSGGGVSLKIEINVTGDFESQTTDLSQSDIVKKFPDLCRAGGDSCYASVSGGSARKTVMSQIQVVPELQYAAKLWKAGKTSVELSFRAGLTITRSKRSDRTEFEVAPPVVEPGQCVPGDEYCEDQPIPTPDFPSEEPREIMSVDTKYKPRLGGSIAFKGQHWKTYAEVLLQGNKDDQLDPLLRFGGSTDVWKISDKLKAVISGRYNARPSGQQDSVDVFAGAAFNF
jgi:hypothetical protein